MQQLEIKGNCNTYQLKRSDLSQSFVSQVNLAGCTDIAQDFTQVQKKYIYIYVYA